MTRDFGAVGLLAQQLREALEGSGGIAEPREHDRDLRTRLPEARIQLQRAFKTALAFQIPARVQQLAAEGEPAEGQICVQRERSPRHLQRGGRIGPLAAQFCIAQQIQGRRLGRFGGPAQQILRSAMIAAANCHDAEQMQRGRRVRESLQNTLARLARGREVALHQTVPCRLQRRGDLGLIELLVRRICLGVNPAAATPLR